ncbi:MAG: hypothetical protein QXG39_00410 [Candidatus Aenigmatarchaeota archaeon]
MVNELGQDILNIPIPIKISSEALNNLELLYKDLEPAVPDEEKSFLKKKMLILYSRILETESPELEQSEREMRALNKVRIAFRKFLDKANLIKSMSEVDLFGIFLAEGQMQDMYAEVVAEIRRVIDTEGETVAISKGMLEVQGDKKLMKDFRRMIGDKENPYFGKYLDDIPDSKRYRRKIFGLIFQGQELKPCVWYVWGSPTKEIPLFKPLKFKAKIMGQEGGLLRLHTKNLQCEIDKEGEKVLSSPETIINLFKTMTPFVSKFSEIRKKYEEWFAHRSDTKTPGIVVSEADVFKIEEMTNSYRLLLLDSEDAESAEPIIAFLPKNELQFGEMSRIVFLASMFNLERVIAGEQVSDVSLKIIKAVPKILVKPEVEEVKEIPNPPEVSGEEKWVV